MTSEGNLPTTGSVESRLGRLDLENGYPSAATIEKVFDDIDFQRACQAYLWALPLMAMQQWQSEHLTKFGAGKLDYVDYLSFQDKLGLLTANATTPYIMAFPNLTKSGPLVLEIPAGPTAGGFTDFWQRPITDSGQTGPDRGAGGRYLILGPNDPDSAPDGYHVFRSPTANIFSAHRVLEPDPTKAARLIAGLRIYPYAQPEAPPPTPAKGDGAWNRDIGGLGDTARRGPIAVRVGPYPQTHQKEAHSKGRAFGGRSRRAKPSWWGSGRSPALPCPPPAPMVYTPPNPTKDSAHEDDVVPSDAVHRAAGGLQTEASLGLGRHPLIPVRPEARPSDVQRLHG
ncbi:MAG: DUF1254 domain-containing protein [Planctomycetota bacterium]